MKSVATLGASAGSAFLIALSGCGGGEPVQSEGEPAAQAAAAPEAAETEPAPPETTASPEVRSTASLDGDLHPGKYRTAGFSPPFSFEVRAKREGEPGWRGDTPPEEIAETARKFGLDPALFTGESRWAIVAETAGLPYFEFIRLIDQEREATSWGILFITKTFLDPVGEVVKELRAMEGLKAGKAAPASLGGHPGRRFDAVVTADPLYPRPLVVGGSEDMFYANGQRVRFIVVDLGEERKVVTVEAPEAEFDEFLPEAEELLATVNWE